MPQLKIYDVVHPKLKKSCRLSSFPYRLARRPLPPSNLLLYARPSAEGVDDADEHEDEEEMEATAAKGRKPDDSLSLLSRLQS